MAKSLILDLHQKLVDKKLSFLQLLNQSKNILNNTKDLNSVITNTTDLVDVKKLEQDFKHHQNDLLYGIPYSIKDNICTKDIRTTGGSRFLESYIPQYDATVVKLLKQQHPMLIAKDNMDEFGIGGTGLCSYYGCVGNYYDKTRSTAGSSSGGVVNVASGASIFSIGTDTGDSIRRPASLLGVVGFKPSYGVISRQGVYPYAPGFDTVGVIAQYVTDCAIVCDQIIKFDPTDYTSQKTNSRNYFKNLKTIKHLKLNAIKNLEKYFCDSKSKDAYLKALELIKKQGHEINYVEIDEKILKAINIIYRVVSYPEGNTCYASFSGIPFGECEDKNISGFQKIMFHNRTKYFGNEIKKRFIIGSYISDDENYEAIFRNSEKYRTLLIKSFDQLFHNCDAYIIPSASSTAPLNDDVKSCKFCSNYIDNLLQISNFNGCPSITIPYCYIDKMPFGINLNTPRFKEQELLNAALTLEELFAFKKEVR